MGPTSTVATPSPTLVDFLDFLYRLTKDVNQNFLVAITRNFNSWAVEWGSKEINGGEALKETMAELDVALLNNGDKLTFITGEATSIVDFIFVSETLLSENAPGE